MKYQPTPHPVLSFLLLLALPATTVAEQQTTPLQTIPFGGASGGGSEEIGSGTLSASVSQQLDQFEKFNPALGTLVEVLLTVEVNAYYAIDISSSSINDPDSPFSIEIYDDPETLIQASVIYAPTNASSGYSVTFDNESFNGASIYEENPGDWGAPDDFYFIDYTVFRIERD